MSQKYSSIWSLENLYVNKYFNDFWSSTYSENMFEKEFIATKNPVFLLDLHRNLLDLKFTISNPWNMAPSETYLYFA